MLSIAWLLIRSAFSKIAAFTIAHWRVILPLVIVGYCLFAYFQQVKRADTAEAELLAFKTQIEQEVKSREIENIKKLNQAQNKIVVANEKAKADMQRLKLDRARETKNLKGLYENRIDNLGNNWAERVRLEASRSRAGMPKTTSDSSTPSSSESECYSAFNTLEAACRITTIDYNELRAYADANCESFGCDKNKKQD